MATAKQVKIGKPAAKQLCGKPGKGQAACLSQRRTDVSGVHGLLLSTGAAPVGYGPTDLRSAYQIPADGGAGQTIAIVDAYDDPTAESDLALYRQQFALPPCTTDNGCFRKVDQRGGADFPAADPGWAGEISLDLDMVSAIAPAAKIVLVEADDAYYDSLGSAVDTAVALGAKYVSNSYGGSESPAETSEDALYYQHPGVAVVASSGDAFYGVQYPAASPYVTAVGGTSLTRDSSQRGWSESVWSNTGGPGSGCSRYEDKPSFQTDTGCAQRTVADVSAVSDPRTGVAVYQTYGGQGWGVYGGTSAAAPIIAGVYADAASPAPGSYPNSYPYQDPSALNDVTEGSNGSCTPSYLCTAGPGYDGPTGLGTPRGIAAFRSGPHGVITGTVTDAHGSRAIAGATVQVGDDTVTTDGDGSYALSVPPGNYDLTVAAYGYAKRTISGIAVTDGGTVREKVRLRKLPTARLTGTVTDGSGHGYPLAAQVTVDGVPGGPAATDPSTGGFALDLPAGKSYQLHVTADYPGYQPASAEIAVGDADRTTRFTLDVDTASCTAPGYAKADGTCAPVRGGLLVGTVTDANTGAGVPGATVTGPDGAAGTSTGSTGSYWLFAAPGTHQAFTAGRTRYAAQSTTVTITADRVTRAGFTLKAGRLQVTPGSISRNVQAGKQATAAVTVQNTGSRPATFRFGERDGQQPATQWKSIPDFPTPIEDNTAGYHAGTVYSVFGWNGHSQTADMYSYTPGDDGWTQRASASAPREGAAGAFIDGKFIVTGGWDVRDQDDPVTEIYDPATDRWTTGAPNPKPYANAGHAVLDGKLYLVGGCVLTCAVTDVQVYDPASDTWASAAPYPEQVAYQACGAIDGDLYCAGGTTSRAQLQHAYVYDPGSNSWSRIADLPIPLSGSGYTAANGRLLISGGITAGASSTTGQGFAYDPSTDTWTGLATALAPGNRGGSTLGFYRIGGQPALGQGPSATVQVLPGYDQGDDADVGWLTEGRDHVTLAPGEKIRVAVRLTAKQPAVSQPGDFSALLLIRSDTPYPSTPVRVSMQVK
ncbi:carboxypeptidase regulatory-like domain-containing protein [Actinocatenispora sera]|uniref:carboxypeptidase regulatory-like domain-containing protein n=1 Tax=Actinocatenispora sera TaxID=390989 RepID=UPI001B80CE15|nr:carboxypeptidase regulatory-like domain-containing protein [Actinocatenispora sera]